MSQTKANVASVTTAVTTSVAALTAGSAIASLGSIGIAGLGTAIAVPLFPIIGGALTITGFVGGVVAAVKVNRVISPAD